MSKRHRLLINAEISWQQGQPVADIFDDPYFARENGLEETRYVFLQQNQLEERWRNLKNGESFTIGETGFGTGLNFLAAAELWLQTARPDSTLHFVSAEKFPLTREDFIHAQTLWPQLDDLSGELIANYPPPSPGMHRIRLRENRICLTLLYGDADEMLDQLLGSDHPLFRQVKNPQFNAWFLDGFAPAKNPDLWQQELFDRIGLLSAPGATFATFTSAGIVRRGLAAAGFKVEKIPGFGRKREMLRGEFEKFPAGETDSQAFIPSPRNANHEPPWYLCPQSLSKKKALVIVGGGIAGCSTAAAFAHRGWEVTLVERHSQLAEEGSGNPQGVLYPRLSPEAAPLADFALSALLYASRYYQPLWQQGMGEQCGVILLPDNMRDEHTFRELARLYQRAPSLVRLMEREQLQTVSGVSLANGLGLYFPALGWVDPKLVCGALADHPNISVVHGEVTQLERDSTDHHWYLLDSNGNEFAVSETVVLAAGTASANFRQTEHLPLKAIRGQITELPASENSRRLKTVVCGEGYVAPQRNGSHTLGATYNLGETSLAINTADHEKNLAGLGKTDRALGELLTITDPTTLTGRAAFRCTTPDYMPVVGPAPHLAQYRDDFTLLRKNARSHIPRTGTALPGLYINCGHGSRGFSYAPLAAELLASLLTSEPPPLGRELIRALHPARFIVRDLKRNR